MTLDWVLYDELQRRQMMAKRAKAKRRNRGRERGVRAAAPKANRSGGRSVKRTTARPKRKVIRITRVLVAFVPTKSKRIRFRLPTNKWSPSYANRGAARRAAKRAWKAPITTQQPQARA